MAKSIDKANDASNAKGLQGIRHFQATSPEEARRLLGSDARFQAFAAIRTLKLPQNRWGEMKRDITLEVVKRKFLSDDFLRTRPVVYIGSGIDIEYVLALGARHIVMMDPSFESETQMEDMLNKIEKMASGSMEVPAFGEFLFKFDFGHGPEPVSVKLSAAMYSPTSLVRERIIPEDTGAIILFASYVEPDEFLKSRLAKGGIILNEGDVIRFDQGTGQEIVTQLGTDK